MQAMRAQKAGPLLQVPCALVRGLRGVRGAQARRKQPHGLGQRQLVGLHFLSSLQISGNMAGGSDCATLLDKHACMLCRRR